MKKNEESDELILVEKDGEQIRVHPLALANHKQLGWKVVGEEPKVAAEVAPAAAEESSKKRRQRSRKGKAGKQEESAEAASEEE